MNAYVFFVVDLTSPSVFFPFPNSMIIMYIKRVGDKIDPCITPQLIKIFPIV